MVASHGSYLLRSLVVTGALSLSTAAAADDFRGQACLFDEDCPTGAYCAETQCATPVAVGALCDRHAMCASGLCHEEQCGALTIESPIDGVATREPKLVVRGRAPMHAPVSVGCGPHADVVVADRYGEWLWIPGVALEDGAHTITASAGLASLATSIDVDTTHPMLNIFSPVSASVTAQGTVELRGRVGNDAVLVVVVDGQETFVTMDVHGDFVHRVTLPHGTHRFEAHATDPVGNRTSVDFEFDVDLEAPAVVVESPVDGMIHGEVPERLAGRAEPGSALFIAGHGAEVWLTVPESGAWSWLLPDLMDGAHTYTVTVTDRSGWSSEDHVTIIIDTTPPGLAISVPGEDSTTLSTRPSFRGVADAGSEIVLWVADEPAGSVVAGSEGRWAITSTRELAEGTHAIALTATDRGGNVTRMDTTVTVDLSAPVLSIIALPRDLGEAAHLFGTAEPQATIEVRMGGVLVATAVADRLGDWSVEFEVPYQGEHEVTVLARDIVGHTTEGAIVLADPADSLAGAGGCTGGAAGGLFAALSAVMLIVLRRRATA